MGTRKILAFAEVIRESRSIALYSIRDDKQDERFFIEKENKLTELLNISYVVERNTSMNITRVKVEQELYKGQLRGLIADCPGKQKGSFSYTENSLGRVVDGYIACKGEAGVNLGKLPHKTLTIGGFFAPLTGTLEGNNIGWGAAIGVSAQGLSRKNRGNQFLWAEVGAANPEIMDFPVYIGVLTGTYIGHGRVQPHINFGLTTMTASLNAGAGVAYKKRVVLSGNIHTALFGRNTTLYTFKLTVYPRIWRRD